MIKNDVQQNYRPYKFDIGLKNKEIVIFWK